MKDPYKILGVDKNATASDIKKSYRKLAKEHHPDKSSGNEEKFKDIANAYDILADPKKKSQYDHQSSNPLNSGFNDAFFEDFIKNAGGNRFGGFAGRSGFNTKGQNITVQINITLNDAYYGCVREIRLGTKTVNVDIKPGIKPGQRIRLKGLGQRGMTEELNGDLILTVLIQEDPDFYLDQKGLHTIKQTNLYDALLGGKGEVNVFGKTITYNIPKCVKNGTMLRIKGKGFPYYGNTNMHGDLLINILVNLPSELSEDQEDLIRKMKDIENGK
jgi:curved DNA-binding protein